MDDDRIGQLLRKADGAYVSGPQRELGPVVRGIARRRRARAIAGSSTMAAVLLIFALIWRFQTAAPIARAPVAATRPSEPARDYEDIATLRAEARLHEQLADRLWKHERTVRSERARAALIAADPLEDIDRERTRAALILVDQGDFLTRQGLLAEARREYDRATRGFPETHWAAVARKRLEQEPRS